MGAWLELFRSLGQALIALAKAELEAVGEELAASGKRLTGALVLFGAAAAVAFWTVALLLYTVVQVLALWLPQWAAAAIACGCLPAVVAILAAIGVVRLRRLEGPARTLARHLEDHREWWNDRLLADGEALPARRGDARGGVGMNRIEESRREVELRLAELREALRSEVGSGAEAAGLAARSARRRGRAGGRDPAARSPPADPQAPAPE